MQFTRSWLPLNSLRTFEAVGRALSFTKAADTLGVTQSAVSRQVQRLEALLDVDLLARGKTGVALTDSGALLLRRTSDSFDTIEKTLRDIIENERRETLHVSMATSFAHCFGPRMVLNFASKYPWIELEVHSLDNSTDLSIGNADVAIIYTRPTVTRHIMTLLWDEEVTPVCAPALLTRHGDGELQDLIPTNTLLHTKTEGGRHYAWENWARAFGIDPALTHKGLVLDSSLLAVQLALEGEGIAMVDTRLYERELAAGQLCAPFDLRCASGFGYYFLLREADAQDERLQLFRTWLIDQLGVGA